LASRIGVFYAALTASSAFGGLLAYGMFQIEGGPYFRWSYLFFLEGGLTILCGIIMAFVLPSCPQSAWFLKPVEKEVAILRLEQDSVSTVDTSLNWKEAFGEFYTPHGYLRCALAFCGGTLLTSNADFLAMVVARLGYEVFALKLPNKLLKVCTCLSKVYLLGGISRPHLCVRETARTPELPLIGYTNRIIPIFILFEVWDIRGKRTHSQRLDYNRTVISRLPGELLIHSRSNSLS
jgi:MFS family permease